MDTLPYDPAWHVRERPWEPDRNQVYESLFTVGNGYLGVRGHPEEAFRAGPSLRGTYVAGVYAPDPSGIPELVNVPDLFRADILLDGRKVAPVPGRVTDYERSLDMRTGVLRRRFVYEAAGRRTLVRFERFTSLAAPHMAGQRIQVTPLDWSGRAEVRLLVDGTVRNAAARYLQDLHRRRVGRDRVLLVCKTRGSEIRIGVAFRSRAWRHQDAPPPPEAPGGRLAGTAYRAELQCGQRLMAERVISVHTSRDPDCVGVERQCLGDVRSRRGPGYERAFKEHREAWAAEWERRDVALDGPVEDQNAIRFSVFHLTQACSRFDGSVSIGAKALSGEAYRGHVFWDTEVFMLPVFTHTDPSAARRLLEYRYRTLPGARRKATGDGYEGAMFAWESAETGDETCPRTVPDPKTGEPVRVWTGELEQHISADVVYGAWRYLQAVPDEAFRQEVFRELAVETARFWASRVEWNEEADRFEIRDVIGPDEYHEHVNNNAFTNYMAAWNLIVGGEAADALLAERNRRARTLRERLAVRAGEADRWRDIAARLFVPRHPRRPLLEQHEGFFDLAQADARSLSSRVSSDPEKVRMPRIWKSQVIKQADVVMLMVMWPERFGAAARKAAWRYYEPRTTHDSSLSAGAHALLAADLGYRRRAYDYFRYSARTDLDDLMGNTADGLHSACMGATWQAVVFGLLGLRRDRQRPAFSACLPRSWRAVRLNLQHRGKQYRVTATQRSVRARAV